MSPGERSVRSIGTLLGVWAHPDDEAYLSSGLMSLVRRRGGRVVVVTATRGEHGTPDPVEWPPARLSRRRERELEESLLLLGVRERVRTVQWAIDGLEVRHIAGTPIEFISVANDWNELSLEPWPYTR